MREIYLRLWSNRELRRIYIICFFGRMPYFGAYLALTLHVVNNLGGNYVEAGVLGSIYAITAGISSPIWGRVLDRYGLRACFVPPLLVLPICYLTIPFLPYYWLLGLSVLMGLFCLSWFVVSRAVILAAVAPEDERAALSMDAITTEVSYILGPSIGVICAVYLDAAWTATGLFMTSVLAGLALVVMNPKIGSNTLEEIAAGKGRWLNYLAATALAGGLAGAFIMAGADLSVVAAIRNGYNELWISPAIAVWCLGSIMGGLIYGALKRDIPILGMVLSLGFFTSLVALSPNLIVIMALLFLAGLFCPGTFTLAVEVLNNAVPKARRGEAFGVYGTINTIGSSIAPPIVGYLIDNYSPNLGFVGAGFGGIVVFLLLIGMLLLVLKLRRIIFKAGFSKIS